LYCSKAEVSCAVDELAENTSKTRWTLLNARSPFDCCIEPSDKHTHKGIMNGIDAVVLATEMILELSKPEYMPMLQKKSGHSSLSHAKINRKWNFQFLATVPF
jgi:hypothetical protein